MFGYQIKDISTPDLHKEADILTPFQKAYYGKAVMFWRIINNCEPQELLVDLLLQGYHNKRQKIFHLQQSNMERVGKFNFTNRLNDIIPLLCDRWLDESEKQMKKTLKTKILDTVPAKCDSWIICDVDIFYSQIISDLDIFDSLITCDLWHLIIFDVFIWNYFITMIP